MHRLTLGGAPVDRWVPSERGLRRWRPIVDLVQVDPLPDGGVLIDGTGMRPLRLDAALRRHLAGLVLPDDWRAALEKAGVL